MIMPRDRFQQLARAWHYERQDHITAYSIVLIRTEEEILDPALFLSLFEHCTGQPLGTAEM
jgi:hypothetical protein